MPLTDVSAKVADYWSARSKVVGAFLDIDFIVFDRLLSWQEESTITGDLLEIGVLYGKSAIVLGRHARDFERVFVCDTFGAPTDDEANDTETSHSYPGLSRRAFEASYGRHVNTPATVIEALSSTITSQIAPSTLRFAHIDGGHLYDTVKLDIENVGVLAGPGGIVVLDDFRALHTPGVAAATWSAVVHGGLVPFAVTEQKLYASFDAATAAAAGGALAGWAQSQAGALHSGLQSIAGHDVLVMANPTLSRARARVKSLVPPAVVHAVLGRPQPPHLGQ